MADSLGVLYVDTSALVKLAVDEAETVAVRAELDRHDVIATSVVTEVELARAVMSARERGATSLDDVAVRTITTGYVMLELSADLRRAAARLEPAVVRSLDAIHVASAVSLGDDLEAVLTYDRRMQDALRARGIAVLAPP